MSIYFNCPYFPNLFETNMKKILIRKIPGNFGKFRIRNKTKNDIKVVIRHSFFGTTVLILYYRTIHGPLWNDDLLLWRDYIVTFSKPLTQCRRQASNHFFPELLDFPDFLIGGNYRWKICSLWTRVASWWTHFPTNNVTQY